MADWSPNPAQPIATLSVANPVLVPTTISFTKPQTTPQSYSIVATDLPPEISKQASAGGVSLQGTFKNPWDYIRIEYINKNDEKITIDKSTIPPGDMVVNHIPAKDKIKNLVAMIYDPTQTRDYFITVECTYTQQSTGGGAGGAGGGGGTGGTATPQTAQQTFIIRMINDFTGNRNLISSLAI